MSQSPSVVVTRKEIPTRKVVWSDPTKIFAIKVGKNLNKGSYPGPDGDVSYWHFGHPVPGGFVNAFVHADEVVPGKMVRARIEVIRNTFADGRSFYHYDIHPVKEWVEVTHRLCVITMRQVVPDWVVVFLPPPDSKVQAQIVIAAADAKVLG